MRSRNELTQLGRGASTTLDTLIAVVRKHLSIGDRAIGSETLLGELGATSVDIVEIIWALEDHYGIDIELNMVDQNSLNSVGTISQIAAAIESAVVRAQSVEHHQAAAE